VRYASGAACPSSGSREVISSEGTLGWLRERCGVAVIKVARDLRGLEASFEEAFSDIIERISL